MIEEQKLSSTWKPISPNNPNQTENQGGLDQVR